MKLPSSLPSKSANALSRIAIIGTVLGLAAFKAEAVSITMKWGKPSESTETAGSGLNDDGNTRVNNDTSVATVTAYAETYAASTYPTSGVEWTSTHLDQHPEDGLGVRNTHSADSAEIDNTNYFDRVVFSFNTSVILDSAELTQFVRGDTDITIFAYYNNAWSLVESQTGTGLDRTANINNATPPISAMKWAVAALVFAGDKKADSFRVQSITFTAAPETRAPNPVPDTGSGLLLSSIGIGMLALVKRFSGKKVA